MVVTIITEMPESLEYHSRMHVRSLCTIIYVTVIINYIQYCSRSSFENALLIMYSRISTAQISLIVTLQRVLVTFGI